MRLLARWSLVSLLALAAPAAVWAQSAAVRVVETREDGLTLEITASWPTGLAASVDSLGVERLSRPAALGLAGGPLEAAHPLALPHLAPPRVTVLASDFDAVTLSAAPGAELADFEAPLVRVVALGMERKRPAATLVARLADYDPGTDTFRRYRRLVVDVRYGNTLMTGAGVAAAKAAAPNPHLAVASSVLADGTVFKIPVARDGVYRIDRNVLSELLGRRGLSLDDVDPAAIRLYGNGGAPLPALNAAPRPADLIENPVHVDAPGGRIEGVVFYGAAPSGWTFEDGRWAHYVNPFDAHNYYFLKIGGQGAPARVGEGAYPGWSDAEPVDVVRGRTLAPFDDYMWAKESGLGEGMGQTWVSRLLNTSGVRFSLIPDEVAFPGFTPGTVDYRVRIGVRANPSATVHFESGDAHLASVTPFYVSLSETAPIANAAMTSFSQEATGTRPELTMRMESRGGDPSAAVDFVEIFYPQALRAENGVVRFATPPDASGRLAFRLSGFDAAPSVWDVTEPGAVRALGVAARGGVYEVQVEVAAGAPRELVAFAPGGVTSVSANGVGYVAPQNLHGEAGLPDLVVVTPDTFRAVAEDFAAYRGGRDGLVVSVVGVEAIFNEFGGGQRDPRAIRDYFKFLYDRAPEDRMLRYALLLGDGHYDYRDLAVANGTVDAHANENWIPPYETEETWAVMRSYTSDDYFGLLDDDEGVWAYLDDALPSPERLDIGIGRFTVQSLAEAEAVVEKIKRYESPATHGAWRTRYTFVADDGYNTFGGDLEPWPDLHTQNADVVAAEVPDFASVVNVQKIYTISYDREYGSGYRIPGAERDLRSAIDQGTLVINYSGHGGETGLAQENLLTIDDVRGLTNADRLPIFVTATCSFGRWDLGGEQSGAEELLLNPRGGAVALLTTVRTVYTSYDTDALNVGLNRQLNRYLLGADADGRPRRLGDALRLAKNTSSGAQGNNRKFNLLGDPSMRVGLPEREVAVTHVGGTDVAADSAALRALDRVTVRGEVRGPNGLVDAAFDGEVSLVVYDAERSVSVPDYRDRVSYVRRISSYTVREDLIWRGDVAVQGGRFEATFVVPKDISYTNRAGRITAYATNDKAHGAGYTERVRVGGSAADGLADVAGPSVRLFLGETPYDTTFVSGGLAGPRPTLLVHLGDESGINTVGAGVGHELLLVVDGDEANAIDIGSFYESASGSYQRGHVAYSLETYLAERDLDAFAPGPHTVRVRAWDVANNASEATLDFYVSADEALALRNVFSYPNPTASAAEFVFEHNLPAATPAEVQLRIYTVAGRPVRTIDTDEALPTGAISGSLVRIPWDGRDEDGDPLGTGVYLYRLRVTVDGPNGERQVREHVEKLAVIR